jgi:hypothetical protein
MRDSEEACTIDIAKRNPASEEKDETLQHRKE